MDGSQSKFWWPLRAPNQSSFKGHVEIERVCNTTRLCSVLVDLYNVHVYGCNFVLPTDQIGPTFCVTVGFVRAEYV